MPSFFANPLKSKLPEFGLLLELLKVSLFSSIVRLLSRWEVRRSFDLNDVDDSVDERDLF